MTDSINAINLPLPRRLWWLWDQPAARVGFERRFQANLPARGLLSVSASGDYRAWLDGLPLDVPEAYLPSWRCMQRLPLNLSAGQHRLCLEAEPGVHGQPFLLACLDWEENGAVVRVATDGKWQMAVEPEPGWQARDGQEDQPGAWQAAWAFDGVWAEPWGLPCNAPPDFCRLSHGWQEVRREPLLRVAQVFQGLETAGAQGQVSPEGVIDLRPAQPHAQHPPRLENTRPRLEWYRNREAHSLALTAWLAMFEQRAPHVLLDAGEETFARLTLRLRSGGPAVLAVSTGESVGEALRYGRWATDVIELQDGETFSTSPVGFRYVKVSALGAAGGKAVLEPVVAEHIRYPAEVRGAFHCSDSLLNEIWRLSVRTVHLCMQNEIWDGIKRDLLPWMGDLYTEALAIYHIFGDSRLARLTLEVLAEVGPAPARPLEDQAYPGLAAVWKAPGGSHPGAGASADINGIPSYTLWWLLGLADYVRYTGDLSLILAIAPELKAALEHVAGWVGMDGRWRFRDGWDFVDWSPIPAAERETFCHLLALQAVGQGADLLDRIGEPAAGLRSVQARMRTAARQAWAPGGDFRFGATHHVNAMAIRSGVLTEAERKALFARTLAPDPPASMTYWHRYLDLEAASLAGEGQWGLDYIRSHWGASARLGMTALWEAFDPAWQGPDPHSLAMVGAEYARYGGYETSLCHGWSAGPAIWLHTAVLGVQPAEPGCASIRFSPCLGDLDWAEGMIPTPLGEIRVRLEKRRRGRPGAWLAAPAGVKVEIAPEVQAAWDIIHDVEAPSA